MKLLSYRNYDEYKSAQVEANKLKFNKVFAQRNELTEIARHHRSGPGGSRFGLCHGVRNGFEVQLLRKALGFNVIGTDISQTAASVPNCIVWDMHEIKPEWSGAVDFIYSNSWDHTYDPELLFSRWASCLTPNGRLYVTWTEKHDDDGVTSDSRYDAFGCSLDELIGILRNYLVVEDILIQEPQISINRVKNRVASLARGRWNSALRGPVKTFRTTTIVLSKRVDNNPKS